LFTNVNVRLAGLGDDRRVAVWSLTGVGRHEAEGRGIGARGFDGDFDSNVLLKRCLVVRSPEHPDSGRIDAIDEAVDGND
jgi:hypothetical protein